MINSSPAVALSLIMVMAGIGIPVMAALNGALGSRLGNPAQAATLLFAFALVLSVFVLVIQPKPVTFKLGTVPPQYFLGGLFVAFYVLAVTFIGPKIGVGNAIVLVLLGQTLASAIIDHYGWFGAPITHLSSERVIGFLLVVGGVLMARQ
jgi:transporter family-2 protein